MAYLRACLMKRAVDHHRNREHELQVLLHRVVPRGRPGGMPSLAAALTLDEALQLAENNAPSLTAQDAKIQAASSAAIPAGELPDPKLLLGVQNYPIGGPDRWSIDQDFMTMRMVGVSQEMPNSAKRKARVEVADAAIDRAAAERRVERLKVRQATALAWINSYSVERKDTLFQDFYKENRLLADTVRAQRSTC